MLASSHDIYSTALPMAVEDYSRAAQTCRICRGDNNIQHAYLAHAFSIPHPLLETCLRHIILILLTRSSNLNILYLPPGLFPSLHVFLSPINMAASVRDLKLSTIIFEVVLGISTGPLQEKDTYHIPS